LIVIPPTKDKPDALLEGVAESEFFGGMVLLKANQH
jgi:hypothetical protein